MAKRLKEHQYESSEKERKGKEVKKFRDPDKQNKKYKKWKTE